MGSLRDFKLDGYDCNIYVETGTGRCTSLARAVGLFDKCFTVDLDTEMVEQARARFSQVNVVHGLSTEALEQWLKNDLADSDRVFFFLDAHFPGADYHGVKHDVTAPNAVPLEEELRLIKQYRPNCQDFIVCDDARIYTTGHFEHGNTEWLQVPGGYSFIYEIFPDAQISLAYQEEGYIIVDRRK